MKQLISVGFGKETFKDTSCSLSAFVVEAPFSRELPSKVFGRQGQMQRFPVSQYPEVNGWMYLDAVKDIPDGTILLLQAQHRFNGSPIRDGVVWLSLRHDGPLLQIQARLPAAIEATRSNTHLAFQGRADVLTSLKEIRATGIAPSKNFIGAFMDEEQIAECYTINVTAGETGRKPVMEHIRNRDGEMISVKARASRKLSLRRSPD